MRFSNRAFLSGIAIVAAVLYALLARPTMIAQGFIAAIAQRDYERAGSMRRGRSDGDCILRPVNSVKADRIYAELQPREWEDVWNCRRRIRVTVSRHTNNNGGYVDWTEDSEFVARPFGIWKGTSFELNTH